MTPQALTCAHCGAPLTFRAPFCAYCRTLINWDRDLLITRGAPFFELDFSHDKLPGWENAPRSHDGAKLAIEKNDWEYYGSFTPKVRNACIVVRGVALDRHGYIGVKARVSGEGDAHSGYKLRAYPHLRSWRLVREVGYKQNNEIQDMVAWEHSLAVAPVNELNEVELRLADSVLQVSINGQHITTVYDAGFLFGGLSWLAGSIDSHATVMLKSAAAYRAI